MIDLMRAAILIAELSADHKLAIHLLSYEFDFDAFPVGSAG